MYNKKISTQGQHVEQLTKQVNVAFDEVVQLAKENESRT